MTPVTQTRLHIRDNNGVVTQKGNCFQAAVASIMDLTLEQVPNFIEFSDDEWWDKFCDFIRLNGYEYETHWEPPAGYSIGSGISPRATKDHKITHAVICLDGVMVFDVHPDRTGIVGNFNYWETITPIKKENICDTPAPPLAEANHL